jgi:prepilin-type N-terminal cleavage/methylation domain-containing protein
MKKNGFTLIELMVVIVVIGILAMMAMPKFQTAADKTKVAEAPPALMAIAGAQEAYRIAHGKYLLLDNTTNLANWELLGLKYPELIYFDISVSPATAVLIAPNGQITPAEFTAIATLKKDLRIAKIGETITINERGDKTASAELNRLLPSFGATVN